MNNLPLDCNTVAALQGGPQFQGWDIHAYLQAALIDAVNTNTHVLYSANSKKRVKPPEQVQRPVGKAAKKAKAATNPFGMMMAQKKQGNKNG